MNQSFILLFTAIFIFTGCSSDEVSQNLDSLHDDATANFVSNEEPKLEPTVEPKEEKETLKKEEKKAEEKTKTEPKPKNQIKLGKTTKATTFYVIGYTATANYSSMKQLNAAVKRLSTKLYNNDFSSRLGENIINKQKIYTVYSNYDNPKGRMTITLGYKVRGLKNTPKGTVGKVVRANDFLVYPLSGKASDYTGKGWNQLEQLIAYRKKASSDFEVYTLDRNYNPIKGQLWIASK